MRIHVLSQSRDVGCRFVGPALEPSEESRLIASHATKTFGFDAALFAVRLNLSDECMQVCVHNHKMCLSTHFVNG